MNAWDALVEGRLGSGFKAFRELCREAYRAEAGGFVPAIAASLALGLLAVLPPVLIAHLIDRAETGAGTMGLLALGVLAAFAALALLDAGLTWLRHRFTIAAQVRLRARIAPKLLATGLRLPLRGLQDNSRATMMRSFDDLDETLGFIAGTMPEFVTGAILATSYAVLMLVVNPLLAVVSLGATGLAFVTAVVLARRSRTAFATWILDRDRAFTVIVEAFASLLTIKSMNAHRAVADRFADKLEAENTSLAAMRQRTADAEAMGRVADLRSRDRGGHGRLDGEPGRTEHRRVGAVSHGLGVAVRSDRQHVLALGGGAAHHGRNHAHLRIARRGA